jgi:hypothetical protein
MIQRAWIVWLLVSQLSGSWADGCRIQLPLCQYAHAPTEQLLVQDSDGRLMYTTRLQVDDEGVQLVQYSISQHDWVDGRVRNACGST